MVIQDDLYSFHEKSLGFITTFLGECEPSSSNKVFVLGVWDQRESIIVPGLLPKCFRAHIFDPDPEQHDLRLSEDAAKFSDEERRRISDPEAVGLGA